MAKTNIPGTGISFTPGGLHATTGTPQGQPIPASKMQKALDGGYGPKGQKQAQLAQTMAGFKKRKKSSMAAAAGGN